MFVEAHTVGQDDWTTLPDLNGHTSQATGESCKAANSGGWRTLHPLLDHYQTQTRRRHVHPDRHDRRVERGVGRLRRLAAVAGEPRRVRRQAGRGVDLLRERLGHAGARRLRRRRHAAGRHVDVVRVRPRRLDGARLAGGLARRTRTTSSGSAPRGFPEGAVVATDDSLYMGFGFEGISTAASRNAVMGRAMDYLLR